MRIMVAPYRIHAAKPSLLRWRAKRLLGLGSVEHAYTGTVTFIPRLDSALRLNPHAHYLARTVTNDPADDGGKRGLAMAVVAYGLWGLFPIYWKQLATVPATEVLAHRVLWSLVFAAALLSARRSWRSALAVLRDPPKRRAMLASACLIAVNWGIFIWAVSVDRVTEASLGYYINPLFNVLLARLVLGETLRPWQAVAVALATLGVVYLTVSQGSLPWVSLVLAVSFALYGLVRKRAPVGAASGLAIETGLSAPAALLYLTFLEPPFGHLGGGSASLVLLLVGSGVATAIPLLAFADAARRLRFTTLGMVQYLAPTLQLGGAVWLYGEPFRPEHLVTFGLIWAAIAIYLAEAIHRRHRPLPAAEGAQPA